ncbi:hypothetical protein L7F22_040390 [Adiantum nelumboides]|nr:hypothetical protein [Adiantum nelumboides]
MGLPRPLGPYAVGFADFELRRTEGVHGGIATASILQHNSPDFVMLADAQGAPLIRIFYPTSHANRGSTPLSSACRWMPSIMYTWGYISKLIRPSSTMHRLAIWILTGVVHSCMWPGVLIHASVATPILTSGDNGDEGRLPVIIFSHGLWACRTTYSALCCDLASHGYNTEPPISPSNASCKASSAAAAARAPSDCDDAVDPRGKCSKIKASLNAGRTASQPPQCPVVPISISQKDARIIGISAQLTAGDLDKFRAEKQVKLDRQKAPGLLQPLPISDKPWESIAMDFIFDLPRTPTGNDGIWTSICRFSKQAHFVPVRKKIKSEHMVKLFMHNIFKYHGMPQSIVSDRDPRMMSLFWKALFENMGTTLKFSSSFHPRTDGQLEEANTNVLDLLKCYVSEHKATWEHYLPLVEYAYNNTVHTSTGKALFEIVEGSKKVPPILQTKDKIFEADKYVQNTDEAYRKIKLALEKTQSKQKKAVDRHRRELVFSLGDWVLLRFEKARLKKMKGKERLFPKLEGWKIHNAFHVSLLRPFVGDVPEDMVLEEQPEVEELDEVLVPEQIMAHKDRKVRGKVARRYLVKFKNYSAMDAKWMKEAELLGSYNSVVVVPEHLDGSANMASYADHNGKRKWLQNTFADVPVSQITMHDRAKQLRQRVLEVRKVIDVLESIDRGLLTQNANTVTGKSALDVNMLQTRLDLHFIAVSGHSFGGATSIVASGIDKRIKCCLAMDVWWEPIDKMEFEKLAGKVPVLLLNTENFDWKALRDARGIFMKARRDATQDGRPLVTILKTIKGTSHQDQSDFTMLFPKIMKKLGVAGKLDPFLTKNINSRACLDFLHKHLLPPGMGSPYAVDAMEDAEHIIVEY